MRKCAYLELCSKNNHPGRGTKEIRVNVRIVAATHRNLQRMVEDGTFREDLWFRLNVYPISIPPLRERGRMPYFFQSCF